MKITMGYDIKEWMDGNAKSITFGVTEYCNLKCKYCYFLNKNTKNRMDFKTAKAAIDYFLKNDHLFDEEGVIFEFMGGEPLLEIDLIDEICDYIVQQLYLLNHKWFKRYRFSMTTNGIYYSSEKVQKFIKKHYGHLSISISVDGNKEKHDLQRIQVNGEGSYDLVISNVKLWQKQFPNASTKATFSHDDLPLLKDSIIDLWKKGIKIVSANVVFEDVWEDGDPELFEKQLNELADYIIENKMWEEHHVRFFEHTLGFPISNFDLNSNFCGMGSNMIAIDTKGNFYPCVRFYDFALGKSEPIIIGNINDGLDFKKLKPFNYYIRKNIIDDECKDCRVARGCGHCGGHSYDESKEQTVFFRTKYNCEMHKANVRANKRFWKLFEEKTGYLSPRTLNRITPSFINESYLYIISDSNTLPICNYEGIKNEKMSDEIINKSLEFAEKNDLCPIFIGQASNDMFCSFQNEQTAGKNSFPIYNNELQINNIVKKNNSYSCVLTLSKNNLSYLLNNMKKLYNFYKRINIAIRDLDLWMVNDIDDFVEILKDIKSNIDVSKECNYFTYNNEKNFTECFMNKNSITVAPNGELYRCPGFYYNDFKSIGNINEDFNFSNLKINKIVCKSCNNYSCSRCSLLSKIENGHLELNNDNLCYLHNKLKEVVK